MKEIQADTFTDHFSGKSRSTVSCVCMCVSFLYNNFWTKRSLRLTFVMVVKFKGQSSRSQDGKN